LLSDEKYSRYCDKQEAVAKLRSDAASRSLTSEEVGADQLSGEVLAQKAKIAELTRRPKVKLADLLDAAGISATDDVIEQVEIELKYQGYIDRQQAEVEKLKSQQALEIPAAIDFDDIRGLSNEVKQKLNTVRPQNIGQASRISGVTPAAVSLLLVHLKRRGFNRIASGQE